MLWSDTLEHKEHKKMNKNSRITQTHSCLSRTTLEIKATTVSYTSLLHFHLSFFFTNCSQTLCTFCFRSTSSRSSCLLYLSLAAAESANLRDMHWTYTFRVCVRSIDTSSAFLRRRRKEEKVFFILCFHFFVLLPPLLLLLLQTAHLSFLPPLPEHIVWTLCWGASCLVKTLHFLARRPRGLGTQFSFSLIVFFSIARQFATTTTSTADADVSFANLLSVHLLSVCTHTHNSDQSMPICQFVCLFVGRSVWGNC